eukprot:887297-Prymnesium_polylepis.1
MQGGEPQVAVRTRHGGRNAGAHVEDVHTRRLRLVKSSTLLHSTPLYSTLLHRSSSMAARVPTTARLRRVELRHGRVLDDRLAPLLHARRVVHEQPRRLELGRQLSDLSEG